jgi:hypothetical protein
MRIGMVLAMVVWLVGTAALAHEGGAHTRGTVKEITADRIVVVTTDEKEVVVALGAETRILRGQRVIGPTDVRPGERVIVHSTTHDGELEATRVMVAEAVK